jgi:hypothetical protein
MKAQKVIMKMETKKQSYKNTKARAYILKIWMQMVIYKKYKTKKAYTLRNMKQKSFIQNIKEKLKSCFRYKMAMKPRCI